MRELQANDLGVLRAAQTVVGKSVDVKVNEKAAARLCQQLLEQDAKPPHWDYRYHFYDGTERTVNYLLVLDSLNSCFWGEPKWTIRYKGDALTGYFALAASLKRAVEEGIPILEADYLQEISTEELRHIFRGESQIPLLDSRLGILRQLSSVLKDRYQGQTHVLVEKARNSAIILVRNLVGDFASFRDESLYGGLRVPFYKRAQIFVADLYGCFQGKGWGRFYDIAKLTAFADYKLPQVLRSLGVLVYSRRLSEKVDGKILIEPGSSEEVEIRVGTIWAVELIRQGLEKAVKRTQFNRVDSSLRSFEIDWMLWNMAQREEFNLKPHHRTLTIYY